MVRRLLHFKVVIFSVVFYAGELQMLPQGPGLAPFAGIYLSAADYIHPLLPFFAYISVGRFLPPEWKKQQYR